MYMYIWLGINETMVYVHRVQHQVYVHRVHIFSCHIVYGLSVRTSNDF